MLALTTEDLLQRRFEWIVFQRGLAPTTVGARQWITHGHLSIGDHRVTRPGYLVPSAEEPMITYCPTSPLANEDHQVRVALRERLAARAAAPPPVAPSEPMENA